MRNHRVKSVIFFIIIALEIALFSAYTAFALEIGFETNSLDRQTVAVDEPFIKVVNSALFSSLVRLSPEHSSFELALSDNVQSDLREWSWTFDLKSGARFHSGRYIMGEDLSNSLKECVSLSKLKTEISFKETVIAGLVPKISLKVSLIRPDKTVQSESSETVLKEQMSDFWSVPRLLAECPIFPKLERTIFGDYWGQGTNLIGTGPFYLLDVHSSGSLELKRSPHYSLSTVKHEKLTLRKFKSSSAALAALRVGDLSILFIKDSKTIELAKKDETLRYGTCLNSSVIYRRTVEFDCGNGLDPAKISLGS